MVHSLNRFVTRMRSPLPALGALLLLMSVTSPAEGKPMQFAEGYTGGNCGRGICSWIVADGEIAVDTAKQLATYMGTTGRAPEGTWLLINSPGGSLVGGVALSDFIRTMRMNVRVGATTEEEPEHAGRSFSVMLPGKCASACVIALMGGVEREMFEGSRIGIHQFAPSAERLVDEGEALGNAQTIVARLSTFASGLGVSPELIAMASGVSPSEMLWLSKAELERTNLLTSRSGPGERDWRLEPLGEHLIAVVQQEQETGVRSTFVVGCRPGGGFELALALPLTGGMGDASKAQELALSIKRATLRPAKRRDGVALAVRGSAGEKGIVLQMAVPKGALERAAGSGEAYGIEFDAFHVYWEALGDPFFLLPRSNLSAVAGHVMRSCR